MRLSEVICKELGVELGEKWLGTDGYTHRIIKDSFQFVSYNHGYGDNWEDNPASAYKDLLKGKLKPVWKPKMKETYWTVDFGSSHMVESNYYHNTLEQRRLVERDVVYQTEEEAIEAANKMLAAIKEEI